MHVHPNLLVPPADMYIVRFECESGQLALYQHMGPAELDLDVDAVEVADEGRLVHLVPRGGAIRLEAPASPTYCFFRLRNNRGGFTTDDKRRFDVDVMLTVTETVPGSTGSVSRPHRIATHNMRPATNTSRVEIYQLPASILPEMLERPMAVPPAATTKTAKLVRTAPSRPARRVLLKGRPRPAPPLATKTEFRSPWYDGPVHSQPDDSEFRDQIIAQFTGPENRFFGVNWITTPREPEQDFYNQTLGEPWTPPHTYFLQDGTEVPWDDPRAIDDRESETAYQQDVRREDARLRQEAIEAQAAQDAEPYELPDGRTVRYDHPDAAADRRRIEDERWRDEIPF